MTEDNENNNENKSKNKKNCLRQIGLRQAQ